jgi:3,4-dihydroxy-2-butanone 4-phosphate synthase
VACEADAHGTSERTGYTEATVALCVAAGLPPVELADLQSWL